MKSHLALFAIFLLVVNLTPSFVSAHCEIPCGIYGDEIRMALLAEHITTVEKSMKEIVALSKEENPNYNQIVRWVINKENHCDEICHIVTQYFMTQRVKLLEDKENIESAEFKEYFEQMSLLHEMLVFSMKSKQSTNLSHVQKLRYLLAQFSDLYWHIKAKESFLFFANSFYARDVNKIWEAFDKENKAKWSKEEIAKMLEHKKDVEEIERVLQEVQTLLKQGVRFQIKDHHAILTYQETKTAVMVMEEGKWFLHTLE